MFEKEVPDFKAAEDNTLLLKHSVSNVAVPLSQMNPAGHGFAIDIPLSSHTEGMHE
jgi:hypothetical protein